MDVASMHVAPMDATPKAVTPMDATPSNVTQTAVTSMDATPMDVTQCIRNCEHQTGRYTYIYTKPTLKPKLLGNFKK